MEVRVAVDGRGVATVTLDRPDRHNALSPAMMDALTTAATRLGADAGVRVVVLTGAGASFCAGGDLDWMRAQFGADAATRRSEAGRLAGMLMALDTLPKPLIARVNGQTFGGGVGLACVADLAVGVDGALFGLTEVRLGLIPATIAPYVVARIGGAMARRVFFSGRRFPADEAVRLGILARAVPADALDAAVESEVAPYLAAAPGAVAEGKALVRRLSAPIDAALIQETMEALARRWDSAEAAEGVGAFLERRSPDWGA